MPTIQKLCCLLCLSVVAASPARAGIDTLTIDGNEASAEITLPGGIAAQLALRFESAVGLGADSLGLSVQLIDPTSPALLDLLPSLTDNSLPADFPLLLTIAAPATAGLAFEGVVEIELYTRNLSYTAGSILRLFSRSNGEDYRDITDEISGGSYRVRGSSGQFSDFLIVADARAVADVAEIKFARLNGLLSTHSGSLDAELANDLNLLASNAYSYWQAGAPGAAIEELRELAAKVDAAAEAGLLANVWQSSRDVDNVAGLLRSTSRTLRFTLGLALAGAP